MSVEFLSGVVRGYNRLTEPKPARRLCSVFSPPAPSGRGAITSPRVFATRIGDDHMTNSSRNIKSQRNSIHERASALDTIRTPEGLSLNAEPPRSAQAWGPLRIIDDSLHVLARDLVESSLISERRALAGTVEDVRKCVDEIISENAAAHRELDRYRNTSFLAFFGNRASEISSSEDDAELEENARGLDAACGALCRCVRIVAETTSEIDNHPVGFLTEALVGIEFLSNIACGFRKAAIAMRAGGAA